MGDHPSILMDSNKHDTRGKLYKLLVDTDMDIKIEEISHRYWDRKKSHTFINDSTPLNTNTGWKTKDIELTHFIMLPFMKENK